MDTAHIAERFVHLGGPDEPKDRSTVHDRPQDPMLYKGRPAPYAVVDSHDGQPVAWYTDHDCAEYAASMASRLLRPG